MLELWAGDSSQHRDFREEGARHQLLEPPAQNSSTQKDITHFTITSFKQEENILAAEKKVGLLLNAAVGSSQRLKCNSPDPWTFSAGGGGSAAPTLCTAKVAALLLRVLARGRESPCAQTLWVPAVPPRGLAYVA